MIRNTLILGLFLLAACAPASSPDPATITAGNAFILEPPGGRDVTMGGVDLSASGGEFRLVGARSDIAHQIEIHTMSMQDGKMTMRRIDEIRIPAGKTVQLQRGGDHLMIFGIDALGAGEKHIIELEFTGPDGEMRVVEVAAAVRALAQ